MSEDDKSMSLAKMFGGKPGMGDDDEPSDDDVKKAKSDAFDSFWDALHSKDKEGARKAWDAMHGEDEGDDESPDDAPDMGDDTATQ